MNKELIESTKPDISIIIPVYNAEPYLRECLDSIINQTFKNFEVLCINDGSRDNSLEILNEYSATDNRVKVLSQENSGAAKARNRGLSLAKGKYVYFLDADDYVNNEILNKLFSQSEKVQADICICNFNHYNEITKEYKTYDWTFKNYLCPSFNFSAKDIPENILQICVPNLFIKLYKKNFIDKYNLYFQDLKTCNDTLFDRAALILAESITYVDEILATYRTARQGSISSTRGKCTDCMLSAYKDLKKLLKRYNKFKLVKKSYYVSMSNHCVYEFNCADFKEQKIFLSKIYRKLPLKDFQRLLRYTHIEYTYTRDSIFFIYTLRNKKIYLFKLKNLLKQIFTVMNSKNKTHKIIKIFGIKLKFKKSLSSRN